jgi:hypothetical protein
MHNYFVYQILSPVHRMLQLAAKQDRPEKSTNAVAALSQSLSSLLQDVDEAYPALEKSRANLLQAEKMALA